jgi:fatty acid-binding protein DegV
VAVAHAAAPAVARVYRDRVRELTGLVDVPVVEVSAVLAAHAGPGAAGIAILGLD